MRLMCIGANNPETIRVVTAVKKADPAFSFLGFIDNDPAKKGVLFYGYPVFGGSDYIQTITDPDVRFVNLITRDCMTRHRTSCEAISYGAKFTNLIHPKVDLEMVSIGVGNYIQENVILQAGVTVGNNSSVHIGSLVGHESVIGHSVFIAHGCNISGLVEIADGVFVGAGVTILPRVKIGAWSVIGAGSVVRKDVPPFSMVVGNPAKVVKQLKPEYIDGNIINAKERHGSSDII